MYATSYNRTNKSSTCCASSVASSNLQVRVFPDNLHKGKRSAWQSHGAGNEEYYPRSENKRYACQVNPFILHASFNLLEASAILLMFKLGSGCKSKDKWEDSARIYVNTVTMFEIENRFTESVQLNQPVFSGMHAFLSCVVNKKRSLIFIQIFWLPITSKRHGNRYTKNTL